VRSRIGYVVALVGLLGFVGSSFLRLEQLRLAPVESKLTLYNQIVGGAKVGGVMFLFGGVATLAAISIAGALRPRSWTRIALPATTVTWTLTMAGLLMLVAHDAESVCAGFWALVASLSCVVAGAVVALVFARRTNGEAPREPAGPIA
jgi:hypothetical protein